MGLLSWFKNLTKQPESYLSIDEVMKIPTTISNGKSFDFELVGESNYQARIYSMMPEIVSGQENKRVYFVGKINLEDDNEYDKKAVNFTIDGRVVGYFSREDARTFRKEITKNNLDKNNLTCRAVIVGGKGKSYGVWLNI